MGLNDMELPGGLIASFYKNHLIESSNVADNKMTTATNPTIAPQKGIQFLGQNQKGICLLVENMKEAYLPDEHLNFLTTILQACKLNLGDVAIVNHHRHKLSFADLMQQTGCRYLLIFGIDPIKLGLDEIPVFSLAEKNNYKVLASPSVEVLNNNNTEGKLLKSKLWGCLKQLFNV